MKNIIFQLILCVLVSWLAGFAIAILFKSNEHFKNILAQTIFFLMGIMMICLLGLYILKQ